MVNLIIFGISFLLLFIMLDVLQKKVITLYRWSRKATHVLSGCIILLMPEYLDAWHIVVLAIGFFGILVVSRWKRILSLHEVDRMTVGEILYPISIGIVAVLCLPGDVSAFRLSVLILAVSDGFAGIFGEAWNFKPVKLGKHIKSLGGSLVFFGSALSLIFVFHGFPGDQPGALLFFALALTGIEFIMTYGFDNLALPLATALTELYILS